MSRPYSWYPLAGTDPVPGDPGEVRVASDRYAAVAAAISSAAASLTNIADVEGTTSKAVDAIRQNAGEVAKQIDQAHGRYVAVSEALGAYATQLAQAQADSLTALSAAQTAQAAIDAAEGDVRRAVSALEDAEPEESAARQSALDRARRSVSSGDAALARARADLEDAVSLRDRAAQQAISAIEAAVDADGLKDGWWDNWGSKLFHAISDIAGFIAMVAGVAALLLAWVPVLGQALAAVALIATAVALVADIVLLIAGEGSWLKIGLGVLSLVTFGAGRVVGAGLRASTTGAQGTARLAAGSAAALSPAQRITQGMSGARNALTAIDDLVGGATGALTRPVARGMANGTREMTSVRGVVSLLGEVRPGVVLRSVVDDLAALRGLDLGAAISAGKASLSAAQGTAATVAAVLGQADSAATLSTLTAVSPALISHSHSYGTAAAVANVAVGAVTVVSGADAGLNGQAVYDFVTGLLENSSAETLQLQ